MNLRFADEVTQDLKDIPEKVEDRILENIFQLEENPTPEDSYVIRLPDGKEIQCLKLQEEDRNSELNHRVTYDIENREVRIYGVFPRKPGYRTKSRKHRKGTKNFLIISKFLNRR